ncbi:helix-turn-helix domain-containing protein [Pasteuria penetrans]|uniref:helix-turn-helix domain-containing protein n=1 Tax=Pasteuria penetrans TaxID=86005 RepID=UPI000FBE2BBD|nr:helix-turn-helix domain-containing protein [Pasteuria penetrans]
MGLHLRRERLRQKRSIEEVSHRLGVHPADVWAIEEENMARFSDSATARRLRESYEKLLQVGDLSVARPSSRNQIPIAPPEMLVGGEHLGRGRRRRRGRRPSSWKRWGTIASVLLLLVFGFGLARLLDQKTEQKKDAEAPPPIPPSRSPPPQSNPTQGGGVQVRFQYKDRGVSVYSVAGAQVVTVRVSSLQKPIRVSIDAYPERTLLARSTAQSKAPISATHVKGMMVTVSDISQSRFTVNDVDIDVGTGRNKGRMRYLFCREDSCPKPGTSRSNKSKSGTGGDGKRENTGEKSPGKQRAGERGSSGRNASGRGAETEGEQS